MKKTKKLVAFLMTLAIILVSVPIVPAATAAIAETGNFNENQGDGIILYKNAVPHLENGVPDGTIDIIIEAMTTGAVQNSETVIPTDIVLVLDVSGSMKDNDTALEYQYIEADGTSFRYFTRTYYGFNNTDSYYILVDGEYVSVSRSNVDDNNYYYYRYRSGGRYVNVYPELESSITPDRSENYPVYQFYSREAGYTGDSKMVQLQKAVKNFIDAAMRSNSNITNDADKHKISIVKFATNAY